MRILENQQLLLDFPDDQFNINVKNEQKSRKMGVFF